MDFESGAVTTSESIRHLTIQFRMTCAPVLKTGEYLFDPLIYTANRPLRKDNLSMQMRFEFFPVPIIERFQPETGGYIRS